MNSAANAPTTATWCVAAARLRTVSPVTAHVSPSISGVELVSEVATFRAIRPTRRGVPPH